METIACYNCHRLIPDDAVKCPHCLAAWQPAHVRAVRRGVVIGLLIGSPLIVLLLALGLLLLALR